MSTIEFYRGETAKFHFHREDKNGFTILPLPSEMTFSVKKKGFESQLGYCFRKTLQDMKVDRLTGEYSFTIDPTDTEKMDSGKIYTYDLEVVDKGVRTVIAQGQFLLKTSNFSSR